MLFLITFVVEFYLHAHSLIGFCIWNVPTNLFEFYRALVFFFVSFSSIVLLSFDFIDTFGFCAKSAINFMQVVFCSLFFSLSLAFVSFCIYLLRVIAVVQNR